MAKLLKLRRGSTSQHSSFTGAEGEVTVDTDKESLVVHNGSTAGGFPLLRQDLSNLANSGVTAGSYGSATAIPAITVDAKGRVTAASTNTVNTTTNLSTSTASGSVTINSSTGNNATINEASGSAAGVMSVTHHNKLDGIATGATNNGSGSLSSYAALSGATFTGNVKIQSSYPRFYLTDTDNNSDYSLINNNGQFLIYDDTDNEFDLRIAGDVGTARFHFVPTANNTFDLGTSSVRWKNIYTNDLNLSNEGSSNDVDGTWGDWTIQEGESDLFLKNNRSGKKYKFNLTEVS